MTAFIRQAVSKRATNSEDTYWLTLVHFTALGVALGDLLEIMPFEDSVVCKLLTGQHIWDALENGLSMYPKQEGRFPQVAGLAVKYDSRKPPGSRLISVHLVDIPLDGDDEELNAGKRMHFDVHQNPDGTSVEVRRPMLSLREELDLKRQYRVVTREYMADGYGEQSSRTFRSGVES